MIGNCRYAALVSRAGEIVWCCLPRFDSEPIFGTLLDRREGGSFHIAPASGDAGEQAYIPNTNVLVTTFSGPDGMFRVTDFAPRYFDAGGSQYPARLVRIVEPLQGAPMVSIRCAPRRGWSREIPGEVRGAGHVWYTGFAEPLRLTTGVPIEALDGRPFQLTCPLHFVLDWDTPLRGPLAASCDDLLAKTVAYWRRWVKHCNLPQAWQSEVIRSALVLKLHCYEPTGAIVASITTSLPKSPGSGRNWDYRYCWLRDASWVLAAFRRLGHFEERESFIQYLLRIAGDHPDLALQPLYDLHGNGKLEERVADGWPGYEGNRPVRVGNGAARQIQNDVYGEMVLALAPLFLDERFEEERTPERFDLLARLADRAVSVAGTPDAGIWEQRVDPTVQTFSNLMCWAGAHRMGMVARRHRPSVAAHYLDTGERIHEEILRRGWSDPASSFVSTYGGQDLDAALLAMIPLRFLPAGDARLAGTIEAIRGALGREGWLLRYGVDDGFGHPTVSFIMCTFWLAEALALTGQPEEARRTFTRALTACSPLGLLSEDYDSGERRLWGNFPQAYSHLGVIHAAFAVSPAWPDVL